MEGYFLVEYVSSHSGVSYYQIGWRCSATLVFSFISAPKRVQNNTNGYVRSMHVEDTFIYGLGIPSI